MDEYGRGLAMQTRFRLLIAFACLVSLLSSYFDNPQPIAATTANPSDFPSRILPKPHSASNPPSGYEGALDDLRPVVPIWNPPLKDPVGVTINAAGTRAYVIEKRLHRLVWVDINPSSPTYASVDVITDALDDPQMAISINAAETHAYVVENTPGKLKQIRLNDGQVTTITEGLVYPIDLSLSLDGSTAYVTQFYDPTLVSVDLTSGAVTTVTTGLEYPTGVALSPDGSTAYVADLTPGPLRQVDLSTGTISDASTGHVEGVYDIAVDSAGDYAYLPNYMMKLVRVNLKNGDMETMIEDTFERTEAIALGPDGSTLFGAQRGRGRLIKIDLDSGNRQSILPILQQPTGLAINQAGTKLYILEEMSGELSVQDIDPASSTYGQVSTVARAVLPQDPGGPHHYSVAVNPAETWALVPCDDGLRQVNIASGSVRMVVHNAFDQATGIALTSDGGTAYVGDLWGIWQVNTANWTATRFAPVPFGARALALDPQEETICGLRHVHQQHDMPPMVAVRLSDATMHEIPAAVGLPEGLAITWDGKHAVVSDGAEGGRLWRVDLSSGDSQLMVHIPNWTTVDWCELGSVAIGPDNLIYVSAANSGDHFMRSGKIYAVRPGDVWRLSILYDHPLHYPDDQAISVDGNWLYAMSANSLYQVNLSAGADHGKITNIIDGRVFNPRGVAETSGNSLWVVASHALHEISLSDGSLLKAINYLDVATSVAEHGLDVSGDDNFAYLTTNAGELVEVNLTDDAVRVVTDSLSFPHDAAVNDARTQVYVAEKEAGRLSAVDLASGAISTVTANLEHPVSVALDQPNNQAIVLETPRPDHYISKVNLSTGVVMRIFTGETNYRESPRGLALTPDRTKAYYGRPMTGEIWGVDLTSGEVVDHLNEGINGPHGFALAGGGSGAYTVSEFVPRVRHVDFENRIVGTKAAVPGGGNGLALTQDESTAYVTLMTDDELGEVDLVAGTWSSIAAGWMNGRIVLDPTETIAYVSCGGGTIWSVDLSDGSRTALVTDLRAPMNYPALDINATGTKLYTTGGDTGELGDFHLYSIDIPTGATTLVATIEEGQDCPTDITLSPDERYVYVYDHYGSYVGAGVWRVDVDRTSPSYGEVVSMARWIGELQHAEFTSDGRNLVISRGDLNQMLSLCLADDCIPLEADFNASPVHGIAPLAVNFNNLSRGDFTSVSWDFGDGGTSTELDPQHVFERPGIFTVALTIHGPEGDDTEVKEQCIQVKVELFLPIVIKG
jgi:DNA-binding beta-propeller fold protein YncE